MSIGNILGGNKKSSSNSTTTTDNSHREAVTSQQGPAILGSSNVVNDASLVSMGIGNNNLALSTIKEINATNTALIGKLADVVKTTSNDALNSAVANSASSVASSKANVSFLDNMSDNVQKVAMVGAVLFGAMYFFKGKK